jgi:PilZ domain
MRHRGVENRKNIRRWARRSAEVIVSTSEQPTSCVITDISSGGARLVIANKQQTLPRTFVLALFSDRSVLRDCEIIWTDSHRNVGVRFTSDWYPAIAPREHRTPAEHHNLDVRREVEIGESGCASNAK